MKILTCALMPFAADDSFFTRDSGLLCRTLQNLGVDSRVVMPAREGTTDPADVIRASAAEFTDPLWWKSLGADAVVFITWGFKPHTPVLRAAREAGLLTCAIIETCGNPFPYGEIPQTIRMFWRKGKFIESFPKRLAGTAARALFAAFKGITSQYHRSVQIGVPHIAAYDTPDGMRRCLATARLFPWIPSSTKSVLLGYPVPDFFAPRRLEERNANIVSIGRWDALRHKRPHMLMRVAAEVLQRNPDVTFEIFGRLTPEMENWRAALPEIMRDRVRLRGIQPSTVISETIGTSRILYCPSAMDGIPLAVVEGLCGGCSAVGLKTPDVAGLHWAVSEGDGSFAMDDAVSSHADALLAELHAWNEGLRDPMAISTRWKHWFSTKEFALRIKDLIQTNLHSAQP